MVLSSDKISGLRKPLLMLNLEVLDSNGGIQNQLIELTSEELKGFIEKLKVAQKVGIYETTYEYLDRWYKV